MLDDLIEKQKNQDEHFDKLISKEQNLLFLDIETGKGFNQEVKKLRIEKIRKDFQEEIYGGAPVSYGSDANKRHEIKWQEGRKEKLNRQISKLNDMDAVDPLYHRIVILAYEANGIFYQFTELEFTEKEMIQKFARDCEGKTIATFNGYNFDIFSIQLRAIQHNVSLHISNQVDLFNKIKRWNTFLRSYTTCSQDMLGAILGIKPNQFTQNVDPSQIGNEFQNAKSGLDVDNKKVIEDILSYSKDDVRVLKELYFKMNGVGLC